MLRKELQAYIDALTDEQIAALKTVHIMDGAAADAMVAASNAKDVTLEQTKNDYDANAEKVKSDNAAALKEVQDKLDALTQQAPVDQAIAVAAAQAQGVADKDAAVAPLLAQVAEQKATLDKYAILLAAKDAGPLAEALQLAAKKEALAKQIADTQAANDKAKKDLADLG